MACGNPPKKKSNDDIKARTLTPVNRYLLITLMCSLALLGYFFRVPLGEKVVHYYHLFTDREQIKTFTAAFGLGAPVAFIVIQILQVVLAPIPGEATGFIGGYLFGTIPGFLYSSLGLTAGSWINFSIGRFLGKRFVRKLIPESRFERFNYILKRQGIIVLFILFVFPGFPKDFLCLFLGISTLPLKVFIMIAAIGRMPGTLMLSFQGALLFEKLYGWFILGLTLCLILAFLGYRYREDVYQWIEKFNNQSDSRDVDD
jgi:uncharacterized membrane protein YdjX (TVP38/TMEM64 family)